MFGLRATSGTNKAKDLIKQWYTSEKMAMESLRFHFEDTIAYMDFPKEDWSRLRTSNIVERLFREVRRRIKVMDIAAPIQNDGNEQRITLYGCQ